ncbi:NAD(P)/FAD-dependent oxidoreductase, partial [Streptomyces fuscichromogenes]|uniref:NAD(P)/FAD-dependent oxidoreductase n=1 Tax=Streptomyces fuscichromogenes TaxID=1324013 RepID=UPI003829F6C0
LSKGFLSSQGPVAVRQLEPESFYEGVEVRLGVRASGLSLRERSVLLADGSRVRADHVVVTTGSIARTLPALDGIPGVTTLRTAADAARIRAAFAGSPRVVVIGGGFIGCEVAASARSLGLPTTVVEAGQAPVMRSVGALVGGTIATLHRENGVDMRLGATVASVEADERIRALRLTDGSRLEADLVVVGIGANPRTDWLDGTGLLLRNGLACDDRCRVTGGGGHVWAAGDVAAWPSGRFGRMLRIEHWANAVEQASALAANLLDPVSAPRYDTVPYLWSDQYRHTYQVVGHISPDDDTMLVHGSLRQRKFAVAYSRAGRLCGLVACDMPQVIAEARRRLGADPSVLAKL